MTRIGSARLGPSFGSSCRGRSSPASPKSTALSRAVPPAMVQHVVTLNLELCSPSRVALEGLPLIKTPNPAEGNSACFAVGGAGAHVALEARASPPQIDTGIQVLEDRHPSCQLWAPILHKTPLHRQDLDGVFLQHVERPASHALDQQAVAQKCLAEGHPAAIYETGSIMLQVTRHPRTASSGHTITGSSSWDATRRSSRRAGFSPPSTREERVRPPAPSASGCRAFRIARSRTPSLRARRASFQSACLCRYSRALRSSADTPHPGSGRCILQANGAKEASRPHPRR